MNKKEVQKVLSTHYIRDFNQELKKLRVQKFRVKHFNK